MTTADFQGMDWSGPVSAAQLAELIASRLTAAARSGKIPSWCACTVTGTEHETRAVPVGHLLPDNPNATAETSQTIIIAVSGPPGTTARPAVAAQVRARAVRIGNAWNRVIGVENGTGIAMYHTEIILHPALEDPRSAVTIALSKVTEALLPLAHEAQTRILYLLAGRIPLLPSLYPRAHQPGPDAPGREPSADEVARSTARHAGPISVQAGSPRLFWRRTAADPADLPADAMRALHGRVLAAVPPSQRGQVDDWITDLLDLATDNLSPDARAEVIRQALADGQADPAAERDYPADEVVRQAVAEGREDPLATAAILVPSEAEVTAALCSLGYDPSTAAMAARAAAIGGAASLPGHGIVYDEDGFLIGVHETPGARDVVLAFTREQVAEWAGRELTGDELFRLRAALPFSTLPEVIATAAPEIDSDADEAGTGPAAVIQARIEETH